MSTALEAKQLRKLRNKVRRELPPDQRGDELKRVRREFKAASGKFATLAGMNKVIDAGGSDAINASKAKRKMNDTWKRPTVVNLYEMWNPEGKRYAR